MTEPFNIAKPGQARGGFTNSEHCPHLVVFLNPAEDERSGTDGKYQVAHCEAVICATCRKAWTDTDVSGRAVAPRVLSADGEVVAARLYLGEAKGDRSAPVLMDDPNPEELEMVQRIFASYAARMPTGRVTFDVAAYNRDNTPATPPVSPPAGP